MRALLTSPLLIALLAAPAAAAEPVFAVEVGSEPTAEAAGASAQKLAASLGLASHLMLDLPGAPQVSGAGLQVYRADDGTFRLVAFVGSKGEASIALELIRREVPQAKLTEHFKVPAPAESEVMPVRVLVIGTDRSYPGAVAQAQAAADRVGSAYSSRGLVWDSKLGLIFPPPHDEDTDAGGEAPFAGEYFYRRGDVCDSAGRCVSVERAEAYGGDKGELWVVEGIALDETQAQIRLDGLRRTHPGARAVAAWVWMGCPF